MSPPTEQRVFSSDRSALRSRGFWVAASAVLFAYLVLGLMEGVLPLHLAERLTQAEIGALYVGLSLVVAVSAAAAGSQRPRSMVFGSVFLAVAGISIAGAVAQVPLWVLALTLAALGVGIGSTGSLGLLVESVDVKRIVTAMVVWSQVGIAGYLAGPLAGGLVADGLGYPAVGIVAAGFGLTVLAALGTQPRSSSSASRRLGRVRPRRRRRSRRASPGGRSPPRRDGRSAAFGSCDHPACPTVVCLNGVGGAR